MEFFSGKRKWTSVEVEFGERKSNVHSLEGGEELGGRVGRARTSASWNGKTNNNNNNNNNMNMNMNVNPMIEGGGEMMVLCVDACNCEVGGCEDEEEDGEDDDASSAKLGFLTSDEEEEEDQEDDDEDNNSIVDLEELKNNNNKEESSSENIFVSSAVVVRVEKTSNASISSVLPIDVVMAILGHTDDATLARCAAVCVTWRDVIYQDGVWEARSKRRWAHLISLPPLLPSPATNWRQFFASHVTLLNKITISSTTLPKEERARVENLARSMGGVVRADLTTAVNLVISQSMLSDKADACRHHAIPIVTRLWLETCFAKATLVNPLEFHLPPFAGFNVSVTGGSSDMRQTIADCVRGGGGQFDLALRRNVTHLVVLDEVPSAKVTAARRWGSVKIVNATWLVDCLKAAQQMMDAAVSASQVVVSV